MGLFDDIFRQKQLEREMKKQIGDRPSYVTPQELDQASKTHFLSELSIFTTPPNLNALQLNAVGDLEHKCLNLKIN